MRDKLSGEAVKWMDDKTMRLAIKNAQTEVWADRKKVDEMSIQ